MAYVKTNWTSTTPINVENLNHIESGIGSNDTVITNINTDITDINTSIQKLQPVVLYEGSAPQYGEVTLSDNVTNYKYIEIYAHNTYLGRFSAERFDISSLEGDQVMINGIGSRGGYGQIVMWSKGYFIDGNKVTVNPYSTYVQATIDQYKGVYWDTTDSCSIKKVIGYK